MSEIRCNYGDSECELLFDLYNFKQIFGNDKFKIISHNSKNIKNSSISIYENDELSDIIEVYIAGGVSIELRKYINSQIRTEVKINNSHRITDKCTYGFAAVPLTAKISRINKIKEVRPLAVKASPMFKKSKNELFKTYNDDLGITTEKIMIINSY